VVAREKETFKIFVPNKSLQQTGPASRLFEALRLSAGPAAEL